MSEDTQNPEAEPVSTRSSADYWPDDTVDIIAAALVVGALVLAALWYVSGG